MKETASPLPSIARHPDRVAIAVAGRHGAARFMSIALPPRRRASRLRDSGRRRRRRPGSVISRSRTAKARLVASISPWICSKLSPRLTPSRSNRPRMMSDASPWVGGGVLNSVQSSSASDSGARQARLVAAQIVARHRRCRPLRDRRRSRPRCRRDRSRRSRHGRAGRACRRGAPAPVARRPPAACRRP